LARKQSSGDPARDYLRQSALRLSRLSRKYFHIEGTEEDLIVSGDVSAGDVAAFLERYRADIRPLGLSSLKALPAPDETVVRAFLWGRRLPNPTLNDVLRLSLYADEILVVDPFSKHVSSRPFGPAPEGPFTKPGQWVRTLTNTALLMCALEPWIEAGAVIIVPEPKNFVWPHPPFAKIAFEAAGQGRLNLEPAADDILEMLEDLALSANDDDEVKGVVAVALADASDDDRAAIIPRLLEFRNRNPIRSSRPRDPTEPDLIEGGTGQNIIEAVWIADETGSFLVASGPSQRRLFRSVSRGSQDADDQDALLTAFSGLDLPVLNNVRASVALGFRETGRIRRFRSFMRDVWAAVSDPRSDQKSVVREQSLADRLAAEHDLAKAEWQQIYRDLGIQGMATGVGSATAAPIVQAGIVPLAIAGSSWLYRNWSKSAREFHRRPAALLVELDLESSTRPILSLLSRIGRRA
jgi:hypothetical protein